MSCIIDVEVGIRGRGYGGIVTDISLGGCSFEFNKPDSLDFPDIGISEAVSMMLNCKDKGISPIFPLQSAMCGKTATP